MTVLPWATWRAGPRQKLGYGSKKTRPLTSIEGEVKHSAEGYYPAMLSVLDDLSRGSWHFSILLDGRLIQHYQLEDIAWHCGLPGDERVDTSLIGNITLVGVEHEGIGAPINDAQIATTTRLSSELRILCPAYGSRPPQLRVNMWEHGWLSQTACPSDRILWNPIIAGLTQLPIEEDDMAWTEQQIAEHLTRMKNINAQTDKLGTIESRLGNLDARDDQILEALNKIVTLLESSGGSDTHTHDG